MSDTRNEGKADFDQAQHWRHRGDGYVDEIEDSGNAFQHLLRRQEREFAQVLAGLPLGGVRRVVEIGCGYGRMTPVLLSALPQVERYLCLDISRGQLGAARRNLADHPLRDRVDFVAADIGVSPLRERFDLIVAVEVLLHFPPDVVPGVIHAMQETTRHLLLHIDPYEPFAEPFGVRLRGGLRRLQRRLLGREQVTDWLHPYPDIYDPERLVGVQVLPLLDGRQHVFAVEVEPRPTSQHD